MNALVKYVKNCQIQVMQLKFLVFFLSVEHLKIKNFILYEVWNQILDVYFNFCQIITMEYFSNLVLYSHSSA